MNELASKLRVSYHLDTVQPEHILRRAADELERLSAERDELRVALDAETRMVDTVAAERDALRAVLEIARNRLDECGADVGYIDALLGGEK